MSKTTFTQQIVQGSVTYTVPSGKILVFQAFLLTPNVSIVCKINSARAAGLFSASTFPGPSRSGWLVAQAGDVISAATGTGTTTFGMIGVLLDAPLGRTPVTAEIDSGAPSTYTVPGGNIFVGYAYILGSNSNVQVIVDGTQISDVFSPSGFNGQNRVPLHLHAGQVVSASGGAFSLNGALQ